MRNTLATLSALLLISGAALANQSLDTDQDGKISRQEAASDPALAEKFDALDVNSDGYLSSEELN